VSRGTSPIIIWDWLAEACLRSINILKAEITSIAACSDGKVAVLTPKNKSLGVWYLGGFEPLRLSLVLEPPGKKEDRYLHTDDFDVIKGKILECMNSGDWRAAAEYLLRTRAMPEYEHNSEILNLSHEIGRKGIRKTFNGCWFRRTLSGHSDWVNSIAISRDGRYVISASDDKLLRLWDLTTGERLREFKGHEGGISAVAVSSGGIFAISGSHDCTLRQWDLRTGEHLRTFKGHENWISSVGISPDNRFAVSGGDDRTLRIWDLMTGDSNCLIDGLRTAVRSIAVSPDSRQAVFGGDDNILRICSLDTGAYIEFNEPHEHWISCVTITPDGRYALSGSLDNTLRLWDLRTRLCINVFRGHDDWVRSVAVTGDGRFGISGSHDQTLRLWDLRSGRCVHVLAAHDEWISSVAFTQDSRYAISAGHDNLLRLWEFDWGYDIPVGKDWAEGARPYLDAFVSLYMPAFFDRDNTRDSLRWDEEDFNRFLHELKLRSYGWLKADIIRRELLKYNVDRYDGDPIESEKVSSVKQELDSGEGLNLMHCIYCGKRFPVDVLNMSGFCPQCYKSTRGGSDGEEQEGYWWKKLVG